MDAISTDSEAFRLHDDPQDIQAVSVPLVQSPNAPIGEGVQNIVDLHLATALKEAAGNGTDDLLIRPKPTPTPTKNGPEQANAHPHDQLLAFHQPQHLPEAGALLGREPIRPKRSGDLREFGVSDAVHSGEDGATQGVIFVHMDSGIATLWRAEWDHHGLQKRFLAGVLGRSSASRWTQPYIFQTFIMSECLNER